MAAGRHVGLRGLGNTIQKPRWWLRRLAHHIKGLRSFKGDSKQAGLEFPIAIFYVDPPGVELHLISGLQQFAFLEAHLANIRQQKGMDRLKT